jgi:protein TonB
MPAGPLSGLAIPILPSKEQLERKAEPDEPNWANVGSLPQDYVKGLKESERTALNTKEYVFYGYFQRIRERLDRAWIPILREKLTKLWRTGRQLASDMDHTTQVLVVLNKTGEIVRVEVVSESGTRDLDEAAVKAFNQAGPFPNPPKGIVDPNGEIQIPWQFVLKT